MNNWQELDPIIKKQYPSMNTQKLAKDLNITVSALRMRVAMLGVKKDDSYRTNQLASTQRDLRRASANRARNGELE